MIKRRLSGVWLFILCLFACGDASEQDIVTEIDLVEVKTLFLNRCSFAACHGPELGAGGLVLKPDPLKAMVEVPSNVVENKVLIVPFSPDQSYLYEKITSQMPAFGDPMPPSVRLDGETLDLVRRWIEDGASIE